MRAYAKIEELYPSPELPGPLFEAEGKTEDVLGAVHRELATVLAGNDFGAYSLTIYRIEDA